MIYSHNRIALSHIQHPLKLPFCRRHIFYRLNILLRATLKNFCSSSVAYTRHTAMPDEMGIWVAAQWAIEILADPERMRWGETENENVCVCVSLCEFVLCHFFATFYMRNHQRYMGGHRKIYSYWKIYFKSLLLLVYTNQYTLAIVSKLHDVCRVEKVMRCVNCCDNTENISVSTLALVCFSYCNLAC